MNSQHSTVGNEAAATADSAWLALILAQLRLYFGPHASLQDIEMLGFSLHHLFSCVDTLYQIALAEPAESAEPHLPHPGASIPPIRKRFIPVEDLLYYHYIWTQLRKIKALIERIDALCQLLNSSASGLLDSLNTTDLKNGAYTHLSDSNEKTTRLYPPVRFSTADAEAACTPEAWQQAYTTLTERLIDWQEYHDRYHTFTDQFADLFTTIPSLAYMERAFDFLLENVHTIFGEVLLDFQALAADDDAAAVATLLLDLMQKADLVLLNLDTLLDPLRILIKHYTLEAEMH